MMKSTTEVVLETALVCGLNVAFAYFSALVYQLSWSGVLTVMVIGSLFTALFTHFVISKSLASKQPTKSLIGEGVSVFAVAIISAIAVLFVLTRRFSFAQALGISVSSGLISSFIRNVFSSL